MRRTNSSTHYFLCVRTRSTDAPAAEAHYYRLIPPNTSTFTVCGALKSAQDVEAIPPMSFQAHGGGQRKLFSPGCAFILSHVERTHTNDKSSILPHCYLCCAEKVVRRLLVRSLRVHAAHFGNTRPYSLPSRLRVPHEQQKQRIIRYMSLCDKSKCVSMVLNEQKRLKVNKIILHASLHVSIITAFDSLFPRATLSGSIIPTIWTMQAISPSVAFLRATAPISFSQNRTREPPHEPLFCKMISHGFSRYSLTGAAKCVADSCKLVKNLTRDELDNAVDREIFGKQSSRLASITPLHVFLDLSRKVPDVNASASLLAYRS